MYDEQGRVPLGWAIRCNGDTSLSNIRMKLMTSDGKQLAAAQGNIATLNIVLNRVLHAQSAGLYVVQLYNGSSVQNIKLMVK